MKPMEVESDSQRGSEPADLLRASVRGVVNPWRECALEDRCMNSGENSHSSLGGRSQASEVEGLIGCLGLRSHPKAVARLLGRCVLLLADELPRLQEQAVG